MPLAPVRMTDTRALFRPVSLELTSLLEGLPAAGWQRPTVAGAWTVRDVVAHLVDGTLRRLSFDRDGMRPPTPPRPLASHQDFVQFINGLNRQWVEAAQRLSPRVLTRLFADAGAELADWVETVPLEAPALFAVSWAGETESMAWLDIGREFTELWHHQEQIRMAAGAPSLGDPRYLKAVLEVAVRGLPHAFRHLSAGHGDTVLVDVAGPSGGQWTLRREAERWTLYEGEPPRATASVRLRDDAAWKLLFNALQPGELAAAVRIEGRHELAAPLLTARSVIV